MNSKNLNFNLHKFLFTFLKMKKVMLWAGAGQIGMAIARRMGYGMKIIVGDNKIMVQQFSSKK